MPYSLPKEYGFFVVHCVGIEIQGRAGSKESGVSY